MKNRNYISIALVSLSLLTATVSRAAFPVKIASTKTEAAKQTSKPEATATLTTNANSEAVATASTIETKVAVKKHNFVSRLFNKIATKVQQATISKEVYIILAIFALGWLGMLLNDSSNLAWLLSLVLYIIFYFPGLIYTLIEMKNYY